MERASSAGRVIALLGLVLLGCEEARPPAHWALVELRGTPYDRGFSHGQRFSSQVRSLYTRLLETSILPYLNRERGTIADVLYPYQDEAYDDGRFSYLLFLESGQRLEETMPAAYVEEMHGIADGAGVPYEEVLILNTFMDTLFAFRSLTFFLRGAAAPSLVEVRFPEAATDGVDNTGDGTADEPDEDRLAPFAPSPYVSHVELPPMTAVVLRLEDPDGVSPDLVRLQLADRAYTSADPEVTTEVYGADHEGLEVTLRPAGGFAPASYHSVIVSVGDTRWNEEPPPAKANLARDVRFGFTTAGYGALPWDVPERSFDDGRSQPNSMGFALRGSATADGRALIGHHFSMLDSNTSHEHTVLLVHRPEAGLAHATVGWTGAVFGFSGLNEAGLAIAANPCDTLDHPLTRELMNDLIVARLRQRGVPIGMLVREALTQARTVPEAIEVLRAAQKTYGWCVLLADADSDLALVEMDGAILEDATSFHVIRPDPADPANLDDRGRPLASVGPDDLRLSVHWLKNREDFDASLLGFALRPQRHWTSYYFRSVRSFHLLGDALAAQYGTLDVSAAEALLSLTPLVDQRDSMNAVVLEPAARRLHFAMGEVPATAAPFVPFDLAAFLATGAGP
jgi:hypothetical protein